jgi:hypothetical protein
MTDGVDVDVDVGFGLRQSREVRTVSCHRQSVIN